MADISKLLGGAAIAGGFVMDAFNVVGGVTAFNESQQEGDHIAISATKAVGNFALGEVFYGAMSAHFGAIGGIGVGLAAAGISAIGNTALQIGKENGATMAKGYNDVKGLGSGHFDMTEKGYTMRQRSLNAIRSNGANLNSAFGNEARNYYLGL